MNERTAREIRSIAESIAPDAADASRVAEIQRAVFDLVVIAAREAREDLLRFSEN